MKRLGMIAICVALSGLPASAQPADGELKEGMDLLSQGTRLLLRGLIGEIEPALRELEGALQDLNAYHPPEVLPNGDIIIRRKVPRPPVPEIGEDGKVEL